MTAPDIPSSQESDREHTNADTDSSATALHHTLGIKNTQGSPGDHKHDGKSSKLLGKGKNPSFPTTAAGAYSQPQIQQIIDALRVLGWGS
jgi:hypothetical protein